MTNAQISKILALHSVSSYEDSGHIYAVGIYTIRGQEGAFEDVVDMTGWSRHDVYNWLGY